MKIKTVVSASALWGFAFLLAQTACDPKDGLKEACRDHNDCTDGRLCASVGGSAPMCLPVQADASADGLDLFPPASCGEVWDPVTLTDVSEVAPLLIGKWRKCGGGEPVNLRSPFEFAEDGKWYLLSPRADGSYARLQGFGEAGEWVVETPTTLEITHNSSPGSSLISNVSFKLSPRVMQYGPGLYSFLP